MEVFIVALITLLLLIYFHYKRAFQYWEKKGISTTAPSIPFGNFGVPVFGKGFIATTGDLYEKFKSQGVKFAGIYSGTTPVVMVLEPEIIKNILTKDFSHFQSHGSVFDKKTEPLQEHLFNMDGKEWKDMRVKLTPTFTSGKMKMMFQTLLDIGKQLEDFLNTNHQKGKPLDVKETMACYSTDVIGSCAFGLECNSFKDPDAEFRSYGRKIFTPSLKLLLLRSFMFMFPLFTKWFRSISVDKSLNSFFIGAVRDMIHHRQTNQITRNDFVQLLIDMEKQSKIEGKETYTLEQLSAQAFVFFLAGFETSSTTMTFCLYELAHNQEIQDKVRKEIVGAFEKYEGKLTYDAIMEMKYLDQVVNETLRKYPPVHMLPRMCTKNYKLPNGSEIEQGTRVIINVLRIHRDPEYYPNPDKFDPDRFSEENKHSIIPYTYMPFGEGPRICIGLRFGVMQVKVGLTLLLKNYKVFPHESMAYPLEYDEKSPVLAGKGTVLLKTEKV